MAHTRYQKPGGEDQVYVAETALLKERGHDVLSFETHNSTIEGMNRLKLTGKTLWNSTVYRELKALMRDERPDVAHFHNTFPLASPASYYAARSEGVPVVQTLHNYRLLCPNAQFFRNGGPCEDCKGKAIPWPGVVHKCYRGSRAGSGVVAGMLTAHRVLRTWTNMVDVYIALTEFARHKFIEGGLPPEKIMVKPNFLDADPGIGQGSGEYALFVGRLSPEKGIKTMLEAWKRLEKKINLKIAGDGPLAPEVKEMAERSVGVEYLGQQPKGQIIELMKGAKLLIFPSVWYEGFGMVIVEAHAVGLPVVSSRLGGMSSLIQHGRTGLHFLPGDAEDLISQVNWALSHPGELEHMRGWIRNEFEANYTRERNHQLLMDAYRRAGVRTETVV